MEKTMEQFVLVIIIATNLNTSQPDTQIVKLDSFPTEANCIVLKQKIVEVAMNISGSTNIWAVCVPDLAERKK